MNIYSIYTDPKNQNNNPIFINQSLSIMAGIFHVFWALYHKMWSVAFATVAIIILEKTINISYVANSINFAILLFFIFFASDIREYHARSKGFKLFDVIIANDEEEAEAKYYMRTIKQSAV